jgi:phosphatidylglycerol:prolipoprotein diacylglycerol transferase
MRPELFRLEGVGFPAYFVMLLSGFFIATMLGALWAKRIGQNPDVIVDLGLAMLLSGVAASRIFHVFFDGHFMDYVHICTDPSQVDWLVSRGECARLSGKWDVAAAVCHPDHSNCFAWAEFWAGGLTYYGGFIGASLAAVVLLRRDRFPFWKAADMAGFAVPMGLAFGRMGCLLAGCCFGAESSVPWGVSFPPGSPASEAQWKAHALSTAASWSHPVHPTQIYESAASLAIAAFCLYFVHPRKRYDGQVFAAFLVLYAVARALLEILRRDDRGGISILSTSQIVGILCIVAAVVIHQSRGTKSAKTPLKEPV